MQIFKILSRGFGCNSYILTQDNKTAVAVDCADASVYEECISRGLTPAAVLLTHGHFDHVGGCGAFFAHNVPVYCGERETRYIFGEENRSLFGGVYIPDFKISKTLKDGEQFEAGGISFKAIATPGHTEGGVCYIAEDNIFSGDTLFCCGVGRTDLPTGDFSKLIKSVKKLCALDGDYKIYCGHGEDTTLSRERKYNPYININ